MVSWRLSATIVVIVGTLVLGACTSSPSDGAAPSVSAAVKLPEPTDDVSLSETASTLVDKLSVTDPCEIRSDDPQSPVATASVICPPESGFEYLFTVEDPRGLAYHLERIELGTEPSARAVLVGADWLVYGPRTSLEGFVPVVGGTVYTDKQQAVDANPGYGPDEAYSDCVMTLGANLASYGASGDESDLTDLDQMFPGLVAAYQSNVGDFVPLLPSFKSGDVEEVSSELAAYAGHLRDACRAVTEQD